MDHAGVGVLVAHARSQLSKPLSRCDASQKGFVALRPQRQSATGPSGSANALPSASITVTGPVTL